MEYIGQIMPALLAGTGMTLKIFFWTLILALPLGVLVALGEMSKVKPLNWLVSVNIFAAA